MHSLRRNRDPLVFAVLPIAGSILGFESLSYFASLSILTGSSMAILAVGALLSRVRSSMDLRRGWTRCITLWACIALGAFLLYCGGGGFWLLMGAFEIVGICALGLFQRRWPKQSPLALGVIVFLLFFGGSHFDSLPRTVIMGTLFGLYAAAVEHLRVKNAWGLTSRKERLLPVFCGGIAALWLGLCLLGASHSLFYTGGLDVERILATRAIATEFMIGYTLVLATVGCLFFEVRRLCRDDQLARRIDALADIQLLFLACLVWLGAFSMSLNPWSVLYIARVAGRGDFAGSWIFPELVFAFCIILWWFARRVIALRSTAL